MEAEPPAYAPPPVAAAETRQPARRTMQDLRGQIIANASIMRPKDNRERAWDDHLEVIIAKMPPARSSQGSAPATHWTEKQALAMLENRSNNSGTQVRTASSSASSSTSPGQGQHYAVLVKRSTGTSIKVIIKGRPQATPEEALEWMLEQTEKLVHDLVVRNGRSADDDCCIM